MLSLELSQNNNDDTCHYCITEALLYRDDIDCRTDTPYQLNFNGHFLFKSHVHVCWKKSMLFKTARLLWLNQ